MRGQHHVAAPVQDLNLLGHGPALPAQVWGGQHAEHGLAGGPDVDPERPERPHPPPDAQVGTAPVTSPA